MSHQLSFLNQYIEKIRQLPRDRQLTKKDLLTKEFLLEKIDDMEMFFAPHNEYINREARIVIVGITPGWTQMKEAFEQAALSIHLGESLEQMAKSAKMAASFSGAMRTNLIAMLDQCGVACALHLESSESLFSKERDLLHTTSLIKYPVFSQSQNYSGYHPRIESSPLLNNYAYEVFPQEMEEMNHDILIIPLGRSVEQIVQTLISEDKLKGFILAGFPHPSGANGHRKKQFQEGLDKFKRVVENWSEK
ncbi:hypothetical protein [Peribacillus saganii]|uniref:hypothetical protein n=1 Tax=Peribacillus saganii TaxID=2303992 RepID=UPI001F1B803A|nr:hypothetical protein [Peribacillus saganii]